MAKNANLRSIKSALSYSFEEAADVLGVAVVTIRGWEKLGLRVLKAQKPFLVRGYDLKEFLQTKRQKRRLPLGAYGFLCRPCKQVRQPLGDMADYIQHSPKSGRLVALCPVCEKQIHRFISTGQLQGFKAVLDVAFREAGDT